VREVVGACPLDCPDACSWIVSLDDDDQPVALRGNPDHPFTAGGLCVKVNPYLRWAAQPDRILHPLKRVGAKGDAAFEQISWDEALTTIAERFTDAIDTWGGESIWPYAGTGSVGWIQGVVGAGKRLFHHLGASRHEATICSVSGHVGMSYTTGSAAGMDPEDLQHSGLIVLWGTNTLTSNQHLWPYVQRARAKGVQVVVIDPVRTRTADRADVHIAPRPGTDGALALALMAELGRLGAWDEPWLSAHSLGWEEFRDGELMNWSAERAAEICDVDTAVICDLARRMEESPSTGIRLSMGMQRHAGGGQAARVVSCIPAVTGDFARLGGGICYSTSPAYGLNAAALTRPDLQPHATRSLAMTRLGHGLLDVDDPPVKALMIWAANPMVSNPERDRVQEGLARDDLFTVVVEHVHTSTTAYADIVLPGTVQTEHADMHDSFSHLYLNWNNAAVAPAGEARSHTDIFRAIAAAMDLDEPALFASDDEMAEALLTTDHPSVADIDLAELKDRGWARLGGTSPYQPFADGFPTASARFEFVSTRGEAQDVGRLPHYEPPSEAADPPTGHVALVSPANHHILNSTFSGSATHVREGTSIVQLHPDDAEGFGVCDGDDVVVGNTRGTFSATALVTDRARRGVAVTSKGLTGPSPGVNATVVERDSDMGQGAVYHDNAVWIRCATASAPEAG
jgi:anaerobic selenocysteine-containing dehydrogenase